jgi:glutamine phosphoribosylpyrophosphate amidotransferase
LSIQSFGYITESGLFKKFQYSRKKVLDTSPYLQNIQVKNFYNIRTVVLKGKKIRKNLVKNFYNIRTVVLKGKKFKKIWYKKAKLSGR